MVEERVEEGKERKEKVEPIRVAVYSPLSCVKGPPEVMRRVSAVCRYRQEGYRFTKAYENGWDGYVHLDRRIKGGGGALEFPTGLLPKVLEVLGKGTEVEVTVGRGEPKASVTPMEGPLNGIDKLWKHQEEMVDSILRTRGMEKEWYELGDEEAKFLSSGIGEETRWRLPGMGIWWSATGSGKTEAAAMLIGRLAVPTLFVVYGNTLVQQTADRFRIRLQRWLLDAGIKVGVCVEGNIQKEFITVAGSSTLLAVLKRRGKEREELLEFLLTRSLLILDEAHGAAADGIEKILEACPAFYRIAMSGTPLDRGDGANLKVVASFGEVIYKVTNKSMMDAGIIPETTIYFCKVGGRVHMQPGWRFQDLYEAGIVRNASRNDKIIRITQAAYNEGKKVLIMFKSREHGELLSDLLWCKPDVNGEETFIPHGLVDGAAVEPIPHKRVDGRDDLETRRKALDDFEFGTINVLLASGIFGVGLDLPQVDVLINAAGSKETIPVKQRLGRGLRGKKHFEMIDFLDSQHPTLAKHSMARLKIYEGEDCFEIKEKE